MKSKILHILILILSYAIGLSAYDALPAMYGVDDHPNSMEEVELILTSGDPAPDLSTDLVSYWKFEDDSQDAIGINHGVIEGFGISYPLGKFDDGIIMDGNGHVKVDHDATLDFTNESLTISAWFRVDAFDKFFQTLISKGEGNNFRVSRRAHTDSLVYGGGGGNAITENFNVNDGEFHHVAAVTYAGDSVLIYIDGILRGKSIGNFNIDDTGKDLWIGNNPEQAGRQWNGMIDDLALWSRPLSASDVSYIYGADISIGDLLMYESVDTLYVDASKSSSGDGTSWNTAFSDLQEAINISNAIGDCKQIWVADGTYRPTYVNDTDNNGDLENREKTFYITAPVHIYGGFDSGDTHLSQRDSLGGGTILTGDLNNNQDTAYHVITLDADTIGVDWRLDGLVIRDGRATGTGNFRHKDGGGIYTPCCNVLQIFSPVIQNCSITNNIATNNGGGATPAPAPLLRL